MKKPIAILDQFKEGDRLITYMTTYNGPQDPQNDGRMPNSIAVFKIYLKDNRPFLERILHPAHKWAWRHLIANQSVKITG